MVEGESHHGLGCAGQGSGSRGNQRSQVLTARGHLMVLAQAAAHSISAHIVKWKITQNSQLKIHEAP